MKTYAETKGGLPFDWNHALSHIEEYDPVQLANLAGSWVTCACGNLCDAIPRYYDGCPKDERLRFLGSEFYFAIKLDMWNTAKETLALIEVRSAELLEGIHATR